MAITKLISYQAEAEILGRIRTVAFDGEEGSFTIRGLDLSAAHEILRHLANGALAAIDPAMKEAVKGGKSPVEPPIESPNASPQRIAGDRDAAEQEYEGTTRGREQLSPQAEEPAGEPASTPAPASADGVPVAVTNAARLGVIVDWVMSCPGVVTEADILAKLRELKPRVPLLQRVQKLEERVLLHLAAQAKS